VIAQQVDQVYVAERDRFVSELEDLTEQQWRTASLCAGWTVRDVAAHLLMPFELGVPAFLRRMITSRLNFDRMADRWVRSDRRTGPELLRALGRTTVAGFNVPGASPAAPLSHLVIHADDVRRPLGLGGPARPEAALIVLDDLVAGPRAVKQEVLDGLRLVATDTSWSHGQGHEVAGTCSSLIGALNHRAAAANDLAGPGADVLRARLA
jgi:uncharacterized protein (TIGR03083 family)